MYCEELDDKTVAIKDILWEFFQGNKGRPPKILARKLSSIKYTLTEFPDGMEVDEYTGTISWTPTQEQVDMQSISYLVSDGMLKMNNLLKYMLTINQLLYQILP